MRSKVAPSRATPGVDTLCAHPVDKQGLDVVTRRETAAKRTGRSVRRRARPAPGFPATALVDAPHEMSDTSSAAWWRIGRQIGRPDRAGSRTCRPEVLSGTRCPGRGVRHLVIRVVGARLRPPVLSKVPDISRHGVRSLLAACSAAPDGASFRPGPRSQTRRYRLRRQPVPGTRCQTPCSSSRRRTPSPAGSPKGPGHLPPRSQKSPCRLLGRSGRSFFPPRSAVSDMSPSTWATASPKRRRMA